MTEKNKNKKAEAHKSESPSGGSRKQLQAMADAVRKVAARVTFLSENHALDVEDHLTVATGSGQEVKDAEARIAERNPVA